MWIFAGLILAAVLSGCEGDTVSATGAYTPEKEDKPVIVKEKK